MRDSMLPQLVDRGLECVQLKASLYYEHEIRPQIDYKLIWRQEKQDQNRNPKVPTTHLSTTIEPITSCMTSAIRCIVCVLSPFCGGKRRSKDSKKDRTTLKRRCPVAVGGLKYEGYHEIHLQYEDRISDHGSVVRVKLDRNRRILTPTPRHTATRYKGYKSCISLERLFSPIHQGYRFERHYIQSQMKLKARVCIAIAIINDGAGSLSGGLQTSNTLTVQNLAPPKAA